MKTIYKLIIVRNEEEVVLIKSEKLEELHKDYDFYSHNMGNKLFNVSEVKITKEEIIKNKVKGDAN